MMPVPLSAWLNSRATLCGTPTFLANAGSCAAPAIMRACFGDSLGIGCLPVNQSKTALQLDDARVQFADLLQHIGERRLLVHRCYPSSMVGMTPLRGVAVAVTSPPCS